MVRSVTDTTTDIVVNSPRNRWWAWTIAGIGLVAIAIPLGFVVGKALCAYFALSLQSDLYRIPVYVSPSTYAFAGITMVVSTVLSALVVRRRITRLDLIEVLKTRE